MTPGSAARRILPAPVRLVLRNAAEAVHDRLDLARFWLGRAMRRRPRPRVLVYFGYALGDDLLCTALLHELRRRGFRGLMMVTAHPELFVGNGDVDEVRRPWARYSVDRSTEAICRGFARAAGATFLRPHYAPLLDDDRSRPPALPIIAELCAAAGLTGPVALRPYLALTDTERRQAAWARGWIVIQSSNMAARHPIRNKEWPPERFQAVVDALKGEGEFVQLGAAADPPLEHAKDLRGIALREAAAVLAEARLFVGGVGFLMHLARAVDCPAVIVFGGREAPWQSGYVCNANLYSAVPCAPCWRWNGCEFDRKCLAAITPADVVAAIRDMLARPRGSLELETVEIAAAGSAGRPAPPQGAAPLPLAGR